MFDKDRSEKSKRILQTVFKIYPDYENYGKLSLLHNLTILKSLAGQRGQGAYTTFDKQIKGIGKRLLSSDINNPYANYYLAKYYEENGDADNTFKYFNRIGGLKNFSTHWYTRAAESWLKKNKDNQASSK